MDNLVLLSKQFLKPVKAALIVGMTIKAFLPQNITMIHRQDIQGGLIFVTDKWEHQHAVRASSRAVKGKGTFREVDVETFWERLSSVQEKPAMKM